MKAKQLAAERAVQEIKDGMVVGLGTGSTAYWAIQKMGEKVKEGLTIKAVATSAVSEKQAKELGIPIISFAEIQNGIDLTIDGADEVDADGNLIKGGGGALLREKIIAVNSKKYIIIVDESKQVTTLGAFPLPVEVVPFGVELTLQQITQLGTKPVLRQKDGNLFITDNQNYIADCPFGTIDNPLVLNQQLHAIPGVVETGLFLHMMVDMVVVGNNNGDVQVIDINRS